MKARSAVSSGGTALPHGATLLQTISSPESISVAGLLRTSPVFSQLAEEDLLDLAAEFEWCSIPADELLFRKGDLGDSLFLLVSGRLEAFDPDAPAGQQVIGRLQPGELIGATALLAGTQRAASIGALRDSLLVRLGKDRFLRLVEHNPKIVLSLTHILIKRYESAKAPTVKAPARPVVALVPVTANAPVDALSAGLAAELETLGSVAAIRAADAQPVINADPTGVDFGARQHQKLVRWLHEVEGSNNAILLHATAEDTPWTRLCLRQADTVLLVANAGEPPLKNSVVDRLRQGGRAAASDRHELILVHRDDTKLPTNTRAWLDYFSVDAHHHIRLGRRADMRRLSRFLSGRAVALALAGGAGRAFAHIGVIRALEEASIPVDYVCGSSMGSAVAGMLAFGWDSDTIKRETKKFTEGWYLDATVPVVAMLSGKRWDADLTKIFGDARIEDLWLNYFCMASSLAVKPVMLRRGSIIEAIRCSSAVPGMYAPIEKDGEFLVDGGLLNNLPAELVQREARGKTIAVNVLQATDPNLLADLLRPKELKAKLSMLNPLRAQWALPIVEVMMQGMFLTTIAFAEKVRPTVDLYIDPPTSQFGFLDPSAYNAIVQVGYEEGRHCIAEWRERDPEVALL